MKQTWSQSATLYLGAFALCCWIVMFMAGHDVWHDSGRPDFHLMGATYFDLRAFAYAFYLLFVVLVAQVLLTVAGLVRGRRRVLPGR
jgi:hypothetical protein